MAKLEAQIDEGCAGAPFEEIFASVSLTATEPEVLSEIVWWPRSRYFMHLKRVSLPPAEIHLPDPMHARRSAEIPFRMEHVLDSCSRQRQRETLKTSVLALRFRHSSKSARKSSPPLRMDISRLTSAALRSRLPLPADFAAYTDLCRDPMQHVSTAACRPPNPRTLSPKSRTTGCCLAFHLEVTVRERSSRPLCGPDRHFDVQIFEMQM